MNAKNFTAIGYERRRDLPGRPFLKVVGNIIIRLNTGSASGDIQLEAHVPESSSGSYSIWLATAKIFGGKLPYGLSFNRYRKMEEEERENFEREFVRVSRAAGVGDSDICSMLESSFEFSAHEAAILISNEL